MGLLDALQSGQGGGGLLAFLQSLQPQQSQTGPLSPDMTMGYGQQPNIPPSVAQTNAQMQPPVPQQPPAVIQAQPQQPQVYQQQSPGIGDRLLAGLQGFAHANGPLPAIANAISGLATGQRSDAEGQQQQAQNLTLRALIQKGIDPTTAQAAVGNPELLKMLVTQNFGPHTVQTLGNGYVWDSHLNKAVQAYEPESKKTFTSYKDAMGNEVPGVFDPTEGKFTPMKGAATSQAQSLPSSIEELQKSDPAMASQVQAVLDGRVPYPTGSRLNPKQQMLKELVTQIDPTFDATTSKTRAKFNMEFGSTSPSTVGGQKILMGTALGHLGEVADSAAKLNNSNGFGWAPAGHLINSAANTTTEQAALANALNDKVAKFSGEVGKLYSGSQGGGVHEREDTRNRMGASLTKAELASGLEASRDLIISKQKALEDQATTIFGPEKAAKYDFIGPDGRKALDRVETAIAKLRGGTSAPSAPQNALPKAGDIQGGYRFKGGNPADKSNWEQAS